MKYASVWNIIGPGISLRNTAIAVEARNLEEAQAKTREKLDQSLRFNVPVTYECVEPVALGDAANTDGLMID